MRFVPHPILLLGVETMKNKLSKIVLVIIVLGLTGCGFGFWFDKYFEPDVIPITMQEGKFINLDLDVIFACGHEVGIGFQSMREGNDDNMKLIEMQEIFGEKFTEQILPADIDLKILTSDAAVVFERNNFGGGNLTHQGFTSPKFIAGMVYLPPGKYKVEIIINKLFKDLGEIKAYFFARHRPKVSC